MPKPDKAELEFIADKLVEKVWQGDEAKRGIATQAASVALAAIQDYTASRYMETADEFTGRSLMQLWLNREARASVALDKDPRAETIALEGTSTVGVPLHREEHWAERWEIETNGVFRCDHRWDDGSRCDSRHSGVQPASALHTRVVPDAHPDGWRDDL